MKSQTSQPNLLLVRARIEQGLSQPDLADRLNVSLKQVWRWENGLAQPRSHHRLLLCTLFHKTAEELGLAPEPAPFPSPSCPDEYLPSFLDLLPPLAQRVLVGRDQDLVALRQSLLGGISVIITGMPGIGKTTLALTLAHDGRIRDHFQGQILWAGLGRHPNVLEIMNTWGQVLGILPHHLTRKGMAALQAAIGDRAMCLVLDDVWDSADALPLQVGGPHCSYVYTTRFPRVAAELSAGVCLSYPLHELNEAQSLQVLHLLAPRAMEMEPEKTSEVANAVGGLPLVLNLVGRFLNLHSTTGQARRVQTAFERLSDARQRLQLPVEPLAPTLLQPGSVSSLASVIETFEEMLDEQARTALYALSILPAKPATFSEAAALATARCSVETLDLLCDLGFLECHGPDSYHMHQVIADYARNQLKTASRDAAYFGVISYVLELLETAADQYPKLDEEMQVMQVALEAASTRNMRREFFHMIEAVTPFFLFRAQVVLVERYLQRACSLAKHAQDVAPLPKLLWLLGKVLNMLARPQAANAAYEEGIQLARALHDEEHLGYLLADFAWQMHLYGFLKRADTCVEEGMALAVRHRLDEPLVVLLKTQGSNAWMRGNYRQAQEAYEHGLRLLERLDRRKRKDLSACYCFLGWMAGVQGRYEEAERLFQQSLEASECYNPEWSAFVWGLRGTIQVLHQPDAALRVNLERALQRAREFGTMGYAIYIYKALALLELAFGNVEQAEKEARCGLTIAQKVYTHHQQGELLTVLASIALQKEDVDHAIVLLEQAMPLVQASSSKEELATTLAVWGEVQLKRQHFEDAETLFQEVLHTAPCEHQPLLALAQYGLARAAAGRGDRGNALRRGEQALQVFLLLRHRRTPEVQSWLHTLDQRSPKTPQEAPEQKEQQGNTTTIFPLLTPTTKLPEEGAEAQSSTEE